MKILKDLKAKRAVEQEKVRALLAAIDKRANSDPSDEETATLKESRAEIKKLDEKIAEFEEMKDDLTAAANQTSDERAAAPGSTETRAVKVEVVNDKQKPVFRSAKDQMTAIIMAHPQNKYVTPDQRTFAMNRIIEADKRSAELRAPLGLSTQSGPDGGYLLQDDVASDIFQLSYEMSSLAPMCNSTPLSGSSQGLKMNIVDESSRTNGNRYGGVTAGFINEAGTWTPSKPKLKQWHVSLDKLESYGWATEEELEDAPAMASLMTGAFEDEGAFVLDEKIMWGLGGGEPYGFMNSKALVTIAKESGQASGTVVPNNFFKMKAALLKAKQKRGGVSVGKGGVWLMNADLEAILPSMTIATGSSSGTLVYMPAGGITGSQYDTLLGMPILYTEHSSALGAVGDVALVDLSYYMMVTKGGPRLDSSVHVSFLTGEIVFKLTQRVGGRPVLEKPITPNKGSTVLSPFVTLAAR